MDIQYFKNPNMNVLNCTHFDLDGVGSHLILKTIYPNAKYAKMFYGKEKDELTFNTIPNINQYNAIVFTDYTPADFMDRVRSTGIPTMILDHHGSAEKFHDPSNCIFIDKSACGARLAYDFYRDVKDISYLEELIGYIDTFDRWVKTDRERFEHAYHLNMLFKAKYNLKFEPWMEAYKDGHTEFSEDDLRIINTIEGEVTDIYGKLQFTDLPAGGVLTHCDKRSTEVGVRIEDSGKYNYWVNIYHNTRCNNIGLMFRGYNTKISFDKFAKVIEKTVPGAVSMGGHPLSCGGQAVNEAAAMEMISRSIPYIQQQLDGTFQTPPDVDETL